MRILSILQLWFVIMIMIIYYHHFFCFTSHAWFRNIWNYIVLCCCQCKYKTAVSTITPWGIFLDIRQSDRKSSTDDLYLSRIRKKKFFFCFRYVLFFLHIASDDSHKTAFCIISDRVPLTESCSHVILDIIKDNRRHTESSILSSGYKRKKTGFPLWSLNSSVPQEHKRWNNCLCMFPLIFIIL